MTHAFVIWGGSVTWLEVVAFILSIAMVLCNMRVHPGAWPLAIASSLLYGLLFVDTRMYGEASLQVFFVAMGLWGWYQWVQGKAADGMSLAVRSLPVPARLRLVGLVAMGWPALAWWLSTQTNSDVPWWDALPTVGSVAGQWLLGRKYTENWPVWIAVNIVSMGLFAYKGLWLTVLLYALFTMLAAIGWRAWLRLSADATGDTAIA